MLDHVAVDDSVVLTGQHRSLALEVHHQGLLTARGRPHDLRCVALQGGHLPAHGGEALGEEAVRRAHVEGATPPSLAQPGQDHGVTRVRIFLEPVGRAAHG
jgi:hypothetical protein